MIKRIKELIKHPAIFQEYRKGNLWYETVTDDGEFFQFPVPIEDIGDGIFHDVEKGILMMRYIRKHLEVLERGTVA